jgi:hypothetical protein
MYKHCKSFLNILPILLTSGLVKLPFKGNNGCEILHNSQIAFVFGFMVEKESNS